MLSIVMLSDVLFIEIWRFIGKILGGIVCLPGPQVFPFRLLMCFLLLSNFIRDENVMVEVISIMLACFLLTWLSFHADNLPKTLIIYCVSLLKR